MGTIKPVHYLQYDSRWGKIMFSNHRDVKQTIASSGCGATSSAMILTTFMEKEILPLDVAKIIVANGYRTYNNGVDWSWFPFMANYYGLKLKQTSVTNEVITELKKGALVVASMGPGYFTKGGHYILLWGLNEASGKILVNDPNSTIRTEATYDLFKKQSLQYFIFYNPKGDDNKMTKVKIVVNGKKLEGLLIDGTTYAPVRALSETLNKVVEWNDTTKTVTIK